ncbi:hypothetical protein [Tardiphaga sp. 619_E2_N8_5]|uniref:hypothetical protein n=1 Tax=unclassified Tardiphaga TaxID=2631404 RepID=UPI003F2005DE
MIAKITSRIAKRSAAAISNATLLKILIDISGFSEIAIGQEGLALWSGARLHSHEVAHNCAAARKNPESRERYQYQ